MKPFSLPPFVISLRFLGAVCFSLFAALARRDAKAVVPTPPTINHVQPGNSRVNVRWSGTAGVLYRLECSASLNGPWQPVEAPTAAASATNILGASSAFYRATNYTNAATYRANATTNFRDTTPLSEPSMDGQMFTVNQSGAPVPSVYTLSSSGASVGGSGGNSNVTVTTTATCAWTAVANAAWLRMTSSVSGNEFLFGGRQQHYRFVLAIGWNPSVAFQRCLKGIPRFSRAPTRDRIEASVGKGELSVKTRTHVNEDFCGYKDGRKPGRGMEFAVKSQAGARLAQ